LGGQGTAIATKELVETPGDGPSNRVYEAYELVMVTRHPLNLDEAKQPETDFGQAHKTINSVLNAVARYAPEATLNPHETLSFPDDFGDLSHRNFIFDAVSAPEASKAEGVGLMLIMEIFESEKDYAHGQQAGAELLEMLKAAGHYPYSDMDREAVAQQAGGVVCGFAQATARERGVRAMACPKRQTMPPGV
jgi:hypothetical protein